MSESAFFVPALGDFLTRPNRAIPSKADRVGMLAKRQNNRKGQCDNEGNGVGIQAATYSLGRGGRKTT